MLKLDKKDYSLLVRCSGKEIRQLRAAGVNVCEEVRLLIKKLVKELK